MDFPGEILSKFDISNLIATAALLWFFYLRIDKKFDAIDKKFENIDRRFENIDRRFEHIDRKFENIDRRFDKIEEKITDIDRRLCRLEGAFTAKECCRIQDERNLKQAE